MNIEREGQKGSKTKRSDPLEVDKKKVKKGSFPIFKVQYKNSHSSFFTSQTPLQTIFDFIINDREELSLELKPYVKYETLRSFSYIQAVNAVENLVRHYDAQHKALMPTIQKRKKLEGFEKMSELEKINLKLHEAEPFLNSHYKTNIISQMFGIKKSQIANIKQKLKNGKPPIIEKPGRKTKRKIEYLQFLEKYLEENSDSFTSLKQLKLLLQKNFGLQENDISITTIFRIVRSLKFYYKRRTKIPISRNISKTKETRKDLIITLLRHFCLARTFIYIDETGFSNQLAPNYGYAKGKNRCGYKVGPRTSNFTLLAAMTPEKIIGFQIFKGSVTARDFGAFLIQLIKFNNLFEKNLEDYVFFFDNARIHHAKILAPLRNYLHVCFNAPYSPQLNPIEELFSLWKKYYRKLNSVTEDDIVKNIIQSYHQINTRHLLGFVKHSLETFFDCSDMNDL